MDELSFCCLKISKDACREHLFTDLALPAAGFVPDSSPGASSYFSPQRLEQETNETFEVLFSAQRNPVIAGLDAEIARNPFRHRTRSSSFYSLPQSHLNPTLSKMVICLYPSCSPEHMPAFTHTQGRSYRHSRQIQADICLSHHQGPPAECHECVQRDQAP